MANDIYKDATKRFGHEDNVVDGFINFITQRSVADVMIATIMGGAVTKIVDSFTKDLFMPIFGNLVNINFDNGYFLWKKGKNFPYTDKEVAMKDGAVMVKYGHVCQAILNFIFKAIFTYSIIKLYVVVKETTTRQK